MTDNSVSRLRRRVGLAAVAFCLSLALAPGTAHADRGAAASWQLPLTGDSTVLRPFEPPAHRWSAGHRGVDLAAEQGSRVLAAGGGVVSFAGTVAGRGVVSVRHGELRTTYLPLRPAVARGDRVAAGDLLGATTADPHCRPGCLHWGLLRGDSYLDPMSLLRSAPARLVPVWGVPSGAPASITATAHRAAPGRPSLAGRHPTPRADGPTVHDGAPPGRPASGAALGAAATTGALAAAAALAHRRRLVRPPTRPRGPR